MATYTIVRYERDQHSGELVAVERKRFETDSWPDAERHTLGLGPDWHVAFTSHVRIKGAVTHEHLCTVGLPKENHDG